VVRGACCLGFSPQNCVTRSSSECSAGGGRSFCDRTVCLPSTPAETSRCCVFDFNYSGAVSVQDIFDLLAAYFSGCS
jgi:hypothetical protein